MNNIAAMKDGQAKGMLICAGDDVLPIEAGHWYSPEAVQEFILLEREECAKVCDCLHHKWRFGDGVDSTSGPEECADTIRMRPTAPSADSEIKENAK